MLFTIAVGAGVAGLAVISWLDDLYLVSAFWRLMAQIGAVGFALVLLPDGQVFPIGWPLWLDRLVTGLCWIWFLNLFNFMDGIDGLAASETVMVGGGLVLVGTLAELGAAEILLAAALAGAVLGFLPWNWHRARIMLGDVGAIPVAFLLGLVLIRLAQAGHLAPALILPLVFLVDATWTLAKRIVRVRRFWHPHREHLYQRAALAIGRHDLIVGRITLANAGLIGVAIVALDRPLWGALAAALIVSALMAHLALLALWEGSRPAKPSD